MDTVQNQTLNVYQQTIPGWLNLRWQGEWSDDDAAAAATVDGQRSAELDAGNVVPWRVAAIY